MYRFGFTSTRVSPSDGHRSAPSFCARAMLVDRKGSDKGQEVRQNTEDTERTQRTQRVTKERERVGILVLLARLISFVPSLWSLCLCGCPLRRFMTDCPIPASLM